QIGYQPALVAPPVPGPPAGPNTIAAMTFKPRLLVVISTVAEVVFCVTLMGDEKTTREVTACAGAGDNYFADEVGVKVGVQKCLSCHKAGGDAQESRFILQDPGKVEGIARDAAMRHNREAFAKMAAVKEHDQPRMLLKVIGQLDHGGEDVLK